MDQVGAVVFDDAAFNTLMNSPLTDVELIGIVNVLQQTHYRARYHPACLQAKIPRIGTMNSELAANGQQDYGYHFEQFSGLCALARGTPEALQVLRVSGGRHTGIARRSLVLCIADPTVVSAPVDMMHQDLDAIASQQNAVGEARMAEFLSSRSQ